MLRTAKSDIVAKDGLRLRVAADYISEEALVARSNGGCRLRVTEALRVSAAGLEIYE